MRILRVKLGVEMGGLFVVVDVLGRDGWGQDHAEVPKYSSSCLFEICKDLMLADQKSHNRRNS